MLLFASFEGFINLLYECFLNKRIRQNSELRKKVAKEKIEIKMKMLHIYCDGFRKDFTSNINKRILEKFNSLRQLRNELIHANLFDFRVTNLKEEEGFLFYTDDIKKNILFGESARVIKQEFPLFIKECKHAVDSMINQILMLMEKDSRKQIRKNMNDYWIGYIITKEGLRIIGDEIW